MEAAKKGRSETGAGLILDHLEDYFKETQNTLKQTSDEIIDHMHSYLHKRLVRSMYQVKDISNPSQGLKLYKAVRHLNAYNLCILRK